MVDEELTTDPLAQAPPESEPNIRNQTLTPQEDSLETSDSGDLVQQGSEESFPAQRSGRHRRYTPLTLDGVPGTRVGVDDGRGRVAAELLRRCPLFAGVPDPASPRSRAACGDDDSDGMAVSDDERMQVHPRTNGVSTRKVDDLVRAMGASGVSKSAVSRLLGELDADLTAFHERRLDGTRYPYLWLDAQYEKVRDGGRIVNAAFLIAIAANERGEREVLGCTVAAAESEASWTAFLRSLVARGLAGDRLVTSDAHLGIRSAVDATHR